ncbi:MAG: transglutaminase family protein [Gammaproteobacteria bacterium]|nr:transglutaminase family protein [Gammaproteobacteria bacterium]
MSIRVALHHKTEYLYDSPVQLSSHLVRLRPAPHTRTPVHHYSLRVEPAEHFVHWQQDPFGNHLASFNFREKTRRLCVEVDLVVDLVTINPFDFFVEEYAEDWPFDYEAQLKKDLSPYLEIKENGKRLERWVAGVSREPRRTIDMLVELNHRLSEEIGYVIRLEPGVQSCKQTLKLGKGSCRDSAWLLVQILRHLGLAARFVSGYLVQLAPDMKSLDGPSGPEQDFTDLHAWCEVFVPGAGWVGLDPTSGLFAGEGHIPLACTPDPTTAAPITGAYLGKKTEVHFAYENRVTRVREDPRVTKPYSDEQWAGIMELGDRVDQKLGAGDVRLTMGGEPTFVSIDDMDGAEWNTAALGRHKRERAEVLLRRLWQRWAEGGLVHHAQGKWYPGEPLPRWALNCYWREDGKPIWKRPELLADTHAGGDSDEASAQEFITRLARRLGVAPGNAQAGYEDGWYYLWKEGLLPENVDVLDSKLKDPLERKRLRRVFEQGLDKIVGFALPLGWDPTSECWASNAWKFRRGNMHLLPGDSPMGLRLPLDSLLWQPEARRQALHSRDPFAPHDVIPDAFGEVHARYASLVAPEARQFGIQPQQRADDYTDEHALFVRTAICAEPRDGVLHLFLPPMTHLSHWLELVAAIEATADELELPLVLEGYEAPEDERLKRFSVTPDPGVIEVNVAPERDWQGLARLTEELYAEARQARLGSEKFMLDGRHTGTGGGNHVTLGGGTPADSPILRRPHLLGSLVRYWQNHPGLSYLFSGLFIGPTSQAPRVDEARDESLYELEIALQQMPGGEALSPWLVDRVMRNLLVDLTGNTHRSEFCIDKLYSPDSTSGRRGLVEFRGFEMPPHERMSLVQMLLLRSLIVHFWDQPYQQQPVRWGTELHDRFMLPHYVERDLNDVCNDLQRWGYGFDRSWLDPFIEFRFPRYGTLNIDDIELELRFAIEPWHVLGEEVTAQGTARFVDSSVERLQVKVRGMTGSRHVIACNGRRLPLRSTGVRGDFVAGVRFKAWQPPSGLHPTIPAQAPLVFDIIDAWNQRALGGCTYHVEHPGGRNPETFPVNAYEAESRRLARFWQHGHTPGNSMPPPEEPAGDYPYTLDLRRKPA